LVDTDDNFNLYLKKQRFPSQSMCKNKVFSFSRDLLGGRKFILQYVKGENPLFDRIVNMSSEQGLYTYWRRRIWLGKFVARFVAASILEYSQGFTESIRILFYTFNGSIVCTILVLSIEINNKFSSQTGEKTHRAVLSQVDQFRASHICEKKRRVVSLYPLAPFFQSRHSSLQLLLTFHNAFCLGHCIVLK